MVLLVFTTIAQKMLSTCIPQPFDSPTLSIHSSFRFMRPQFNTRPRYPVRCYVFCSQLEKSMRCLISCSHNLYTSRMPNTKTSSRCSQLSIYPKTSIHPAHPSDIQMAKTTLRLENLSKISPLSKVADLINTLRLMRKLTFTHLLYQGH